MLRHASNLSRACTQLSRACSVRDAAGLNGLAETSIVPTGCVRWPLATEARAPWCRRPEKPAIERPSEKGHFLPNGLGARAVGAMYSKFRYRILVRLVQ